VEMDCTGGQLRILTAKTRPFFGSLAGQRG